MFTFTWPVQLCFPVEQHVRTLFALELLFYVWLPDGGHSRVVQVKPVASLLTDKEDELRENRQNQKIKTLNWEQIRLQMAGKSCLNACGVDEGFRLGIGFWSELPGSLDVEASGFRAGSAREQVSVTGGFAFSATRVPFDTSMKTSLWDCRNWTTNREKKLDYTSEK